MLGDCRGRFHLTAYHEICVRNPVQIPSLSLPNDKILRFSKLKAYADDKIILTQKLKFVLGSEVNVVGKGENAGYQHFFPFPIMFSKIFFSRRVKSRD